MHCFVSRDSSCHNFSSRKEMPSSPKVVVRGLRSLIGCSFLRAYWLLLGINISFINVGLRLCCVLICYVDLLHLNWLC